MLLKRSSAYNTFGQTEGQADSYAPPKTLLAGGIIIWYCHHQIAREAPIESCVTCYEESQIKLKHVKFSIRCRIILHTKT